MRVRTQVNELAKLDIVINLAFMGIDKLTRDMIAAFDILEADIRAKLALFANDRAMFKPRHRVDDGIAADFDIRVNVRRIRVHNRDALAHELFILAAAQDFLRTGQLQARVDAERIFIIVSSHSPDFSPFFLRISRTSGR